MTWPIWHGKVCIFYELFAWPSVYGWLSWPLRTCVTSRAQDDVGILQGLILMMSVYHRDSYWWCRYTTGTHTDDVAIPQGLTLMMSVYHRDSHWWCRYTTGTHTDDVGIPQGLTLMMSVYHRDSHWWCRYTTGTHTDDVGIPQGLTLMMSVYHRDSHWWCRYTTGTHTDDVGIPQGLTLMMSVYHRDSHWWCRYTTGTHTGPFGSIRKVLAFLVNILWVVRVLGFVSSTVVMLENLISKWHNHHIDGLVQERRNSIANALELHFSCTNPSISPKVFVIKDLFYWHRLSYIRAWISNHIQ